MKHLSNLPRFIASLIVLTFLGFSDAKAQGSKNSSEINFIENSLGEAIKQASAKNKYIFVDAYASWCGPCKMLKATTFKNNKVAEFYNNNFINVAIDMEKGDGPKLASAWGLRAYPTLIILNSKGKAVYGTVGFIRPDDLIQFGVKGLTK
jgi:thiol:disulfide interchange protein